MPSETEYDSSDEEDEDDWDSRYDNVPWVIHNGQKVSELEVIIYIHDDRHRFVSGVNTILETNLDEYVRVLKARVTNPMPCPTEIYEWIVYSDAVNCAAALCEGETPLQNNFNCTIDGKTPLHEAASLFRFEMVDLFIRHGADTNAVTTHKSHYGANLTPLEYTLSEFHNDLLHTGRVLDMERSIFKLLIMYFLPEMEGMLETIRLLECATHDVNKIFYRYAMEGKTIEMVPLLIIARERAIAPIDLHKISPFYGRVNLRQGIREKMKSLDYEVMELSTLKIDRDRPVQMCEHKRERLDDALFLLDLFESAGDDIVSYLRSCRLQNNMPLEDLVEGVAAIFKKSGFLLKEVDTDFSQIISIIKRCRSKLLSGLKSDMFQIFNRKPMRSPGYRLWHDVNLQIPTSPGSLCHVKPEPRRSHLARQLEWIKISNPPWNLDVLFELPASLPSKYIMEKPVKGETNAIHRCVLPLQSRWVRASLAQPEPRRSHLPRKLEWINISNPHWYLDVHLEIPANLPSRCYSSSASYKPVKVKGETNAIHRCVLPSQSSWLRASLALACKRWIKYV